MQSSSLKINLFLLIALILIISCNNNKKIVKVLSDKLSNKIDLIDSLKCYTFHEEWIDRPSTDDIKIVTYIDGGCGSCLSELEQWNEFINEIKFEHVQFLFYVRTFSLAELSAVLKEINFSYPIIIDYKNYFFTRNKLPEDKIYQTFLVNKDDVIVLVGNPLYSPKIKDLYLKTIKRTNSERSTIPKL